MITTTEQTSLEVDGKRTITRVFKSTNKDYLKKIEQRYSDSTDWVITKPLHFQWWAFHWMFAVERN